MNWRVHIVHQLYESTENDMIYTFVHTHGQEVTSIFWMLSGDFGLKSAHSLIELD